MAKNSYIPAKDAELRDFAVNFNTVVREHLADFNITQEQSDALDTKVQDFVAKLSAHQVAKDEAQAATANKNESRSSTEKDLRDIAQIIQNVPNISPGLLELAGLPVHDTTPTPVVPVQPESLEANGEDTGENHLNWKAGDNKPRTLYVVEAKIGESPDFVMVDVVTKTKYIHQKQTPGVRVSYRVRAKRGEQVSAPSNVATVYES